MLTKAKLTLIAFSGDILFPPNLMLEIYDALVQIGQGDRSEYICIDSDYGHDAFLVEIEKIEDYIKKALNE
jgi:homoserine O-acetyltransferase